MWPQDMQIETRKRSHQCWLVHLRNTGQTTHKKLHAACTAATSRTTMFHKNQSVKWRTAASEVLNYWSYMALALLTKYKGGWERWGRYGKQEKCTQCFVGKHEERRPQGIIRRRWGDNIKMGLKYEGMVWTWIIWVRTRTSGDKLWTP